MKLLAVATVTAILTTSSASVEAGDKGFVLDEATIDGVQAAYKAGTSTAELVVKRYQERILAYDKAGPKLNVVVFLNPEAINEAKALDATFRRTGRLLGPLHGIPVLLKDNIDTATMPTSNAIVTASTTRGPDSEKIFRNDGGLIMRLGRGGQKRPKDNSGIGPQAGRFHAINRSSPGAVKGGAEMSYSQLLSAWKLRFHRPRSRSSTSGGFSLVTHW